MEGGVDVVRSRPARMNGRISPQYVVVGQDVRVPATFHGGDVVPDQGGAAVELRLWKRRPYAHCCTPILSVLDSSGSGVTTTPRR